MSAYDVVVVGGGSMGAAATYYHARAGAKVRCLEQFHLVHDKGSHSGHTRLIRKAYFEHPDYVPLLDRAYYNWQELEKVSGQKIYEATGILYMVPEAHELMKGLRLSAEKYQIPLHTDPEHPFALAQDFSAVLEPEAGYLDANKAIQTFAAQAQLLGGVIQEEEAVIHWEKIDGRYQVQTNKGVYEAGQLIFTAGAWTGKLLPEFAPQLKVTEQLVTWWKPEHPEKFQSELFPCWGLIGGQYEGLMYGFPMMSRDPGQPDLMKVAYHFPGPPKRTNHGDQVEIELIRDFLDKHLTGGFTLFDTKSCFYTYSPDEHFMVDHLPDDPNVWVACGFSGHGFKFASVIGEVLAELVLKGSTDQPIAFLSRERLQ